MVRRPPCGLLLAEGKCRQVDRIDASCAVLELARLSQLAPDTTAKLLILFARGP